MRKSRVELMDQHQADGLALEHAVDRYDVVTVERGAGGGFIATIDDSWTGSEFVTIEAAIGSAESMKREKNAPKK